MTSPGFDWNGLMKLGGFVAEERTVFVPIKPTTPPPDPRTKRYVAKRFQQVARKNVSAAGLLRKLLREKEEWEESAEKGSFAILALAHRENSKKMAAWALSTIIDGVREIVYKRECDWIQNMIVKELMDRCFLRAEAKRAAKQELEDMLETVFQRTTVCRTGGMFEDEAQLLLQYLTVRLGSHPSVPDIALAMADFGLDENEIESKCCRLDTDFKGRVLFGALKRMLEDSAASWWKTRKKTQTIPSTPSMSPTTPANVSYNSVGQMLEWEVLTKQASQLALSIPPPLPDTSDCLQLYRGHYDERCSKSLRNRFICIYLCCSSDDVGHEHQAVYRMVPSLRILAAILGYAVEIVDLNWAMSEKTRRNRLYEEMFENHSVASVRDKELEQCLKLSAGPAFLAFAGDRPGAARVPTALPEQSFKSIIHILEKSGKAPQSKLLKEWYVPDTNQDEIVYHLQPVSAILNETRLNAKKFSNDDSTSFDWRNSWKIGESIRHAFSLAAALSGRPKQWLSITESNVEHDIRIGLVENNLRSSQCLFFGRNFFGKDWPPSHVRAQMRAGVTSWVNLKKINGQIDEVVLSRFRGIKALNTPEPKIPAYNARIYHVPWSSKDGMDPIDPIVSQYLDSFSKDTFASLARSLMRTFERDRTADDPMYREILDHLMYMHQAARPAIQFRRSFAADIVDSYLKMPNTEKSILAFHGASGCGMTSFLAACACKAREDFPNATVIYRCIGLTSSSCHVRSFTTLLCKQLMYPKREDTIACCSSIISVRERLQMAIRQHASERNLILFLDGVHLLKLGIGHPPLQWLIPAELEENVKVVIGLDSTNAQPCIHALRNGSHQVHELEFFTSFQANEVLTHTILRHPVRKVTQSQIEALRKTTTRCTEYSPLFFGILKSLASSWHSAMSGYAIDLPSTVSGLIRDILLRAQQVFGPVLVSRGLAVFSVARLGLCDYEAVAILGSDDKIMDEVAESWDLPDWKFPPFVWIRLRQWLSPFLFRSNALVVDGAACWRWLHSSFATTVCDMFFRHTGQTEQQRPNLFSFAQGHALLARYFHLQPYLFYGTMGEPSSVYNLRKLRELIYHQIRAAQWTELASNMCNLNHIEAMIRCFGPHELLDQYSEVLSIAELDTLKDRILIFARFVERNREALSVAPDSVMALARNEPDASPITYAANSVMHGNRASPAAILGHHRIWNKTQYTNPLIRTNKRHSGAITCVASSAKGPLVASASVDTLVVLWDAYSGQELRVLDGHLDIVWCVAFSPNGRRLVTASADGTARLWDVGSGTEDVVFASHSGCVWCAQFTSDGEFVASGGSDKTARVWKSRTGEQMHVLTMFSASVRTLCFSPVGTTGILAVGDDDGFCWLVAYKTHKVAAKMQCAQSVSSVIFSPTGRVFVTCSGSQCGVWDTHGRLVLALRHDLPVSCASITADVGPASQIVTGDIGGTVRVFSSGDGKTVLKLEAHPGRTIHAMDARAPGGALVTGSEDGLLRFWDFPVVLSTAHRIKSGKMGLGASNRVSTTSVNGDDTKIPSINLTIKIANSNSSDIDVGPTRHTTAPEPPTPVVPALLPNPAPIVSISTTDRCDEIATADANGKILFWDLNGSILQSIECPGVTAIACSPFAELAVINGTSQVSVLDSRTGISRMTLVGHRANTTAIAYSPSGTQAASASADCTIRIWDSNVGIAQITLTGHSAAIRVLCFSPTGRRLASGSDDTTIRLWSSQGSKKACLVGHTGSVRAVNFSYKGKLLVSGGTDHEVRVWKVETGAPLRVLQGHTDFVTAVAFSPSGSWVISGSCESDPTLRVWNVATCSQRAILTGHVGTVVGLAWLADDKGVISAGSDGSIRSWENLIDDKLKENHLGTGIVQPLPESDVETESEDESDDDLLHY